MNKRIVLPVILVPFLVISLIFTVGCEEQESTPKMTAPEVCQYVNQALPNEYQYLGSTARNELRYTSKEAEYVGGLLWSNESEARAPEGTWLVTVKVVVEPQRLKEGQWVSGISLPYIVFYYFYEDTGALVLVEE